MQILETRHIFYSGKTVMIRALNPDDASLIYSWMHEKFYSYYKPYFKRICTSASFIAQRIEALASLDTPFEIEALILHRPLNTPLGLVSLSNIDTINLKAEFSIAFQRGFGTRSVPETLSFLFHYVFFILKFNKLYFYVTSDNFRILNMIQRYSIIQEGKLHKEILSETGEWVDLYRFCILSEDWIPSPLNKKLQSISKELQ
jgi:RimJ/RimL family protein N-acetyltransferase